MNKIIRVILTVGLTLLLSSSVYAAADNNGSTAGANLTIGSDTDPGGTLVFTPSPTTLMTSSVAANAYTLTSVSKNNLGNEAGMEYCVGSALSGVFKKQAGTAITTASGTTGSTMPGFK